MTDWLDWLLEELEEDEDQGEDLELRTHVLPRSEGEETGAAAEERSGPNSAVGRMAATSADEAAENFSGSPWAGMLEAKNMSLAEYDSSLPDGTVFDAVFSNPPYFESSLKAPDMRRRAARHADTLSYRDVICFASDWLSADGRLSMVLPADQEREVRRYAVSMGLYPFRLVRVRTSPRRPFSRMVIEFSRGGAAAGPGIIPSESVLTIMEEGTYSAEYRSLVSDFLFI